MSFIPMMAKQIFQKPLLQSFIYYYYFKYNFFVTLCMCLLSLLITFESLLNKSINLF